MQAFFTQYKTTWLVGNTSMKGLWEFSETAQGVLSAKLYLL